MTIINQYIVDRRSFNSICSSATEGKPAKLSEVYILFIIPGSKINSFIKLIFLNPIITPLCRCQGRKAFI